MSEFPVYVSVMNDGTVMVRIPERHGDEWARTYGGDAKSALVAAGEYVQVLIDEHQQLRGLIDRQRVPGWDSLVPTDLTPEERQRFSDALDSM